MTNTDSESVATPAFQGMYLELFLKMCPSVSLLRLAATVENLEDFQQALTARPYSEPK